MAIQQPRPGLRDDEGSVLPLLLGATGLALALTLVVAAAAGLYLDHKRLLGVADAAARVGAEAFALHEVSVTSDGELEAELDSVVVRRAVEAFLDSQQTDFEGLELVSAESPDGRSAVVRLTAWWRPPLLGPALPEGLPVEVTSTARTVFH